MTSDSVPDNFDLSVAKDRRSSTDISERRQCPKCNSINIRVKSPSGSNQTREDMADYQCCQCGTHFND